MEVKVLKFGGSSLADASQFRKVAQIIKSEPERRYVVASAPGKRFSDDVKVTDMLYKCFNLAKNNENIDDEFKKIEDRYNKIISDLELDFSLKEEFEKIKIAIFHAGSDYISSRGEYLNSMILAEYLGYDFIDAEKVIFFHEDGNFDAHTTNKVLASVLENHEYAVIPGFYGSMPNGTIKTFSRGGSDITGSIVARAIGASLYENWTDVSGMLMADPRIVENPKVIDIISYKELRELSYMGATVMHEDAIFPVSESGIPINIKNTNAPQDKGTFIVPSTEKAEGGRMVTGVAGRQGFSSITVEKDMMNQELGFGRRVLEVLERYGVPFEHLPTGIDTMSVVVSTAAIVDKMDNISTDIYRAVKADKVRIDHGIAMIAIVGKSLINTKGTAVRLFSAIYKADINVRMMDLGSSELNVIIGVDEKDYANALRAIYAEFITR
ncbi:aspartate kinase [Tissierella creatinini]|nr:aspartate kinase [Tissierella creatinini]TJX63073.1 aspartate kinase [Soehngenia saccharolytica]